MFLRRNNTMKRKVKVIITGEYELDTDYGGHLQLDSQLTNNIILSEEQLIEEMKKEIKNLSETDEDCDVYYLVMNLHNREIKID